MKLEHRYSDEVIERGEGYLNSVEHCIKLGNSIYGKVQGSNMYKTEVDLNSLKGDCSCPYGTNCKHAVALYLTYQKGKFWDADEFTKALDKMSHEELKEMILSKLKDNPDWIKKHKLIKSFDKKDFLNNFKKKFSSMLVSEAQTILPKLSFEDMLNLEDYISRNYDDLAEKLSEETENDDYPYDYNYDNEEYDSELLDLHESLTEVIVKRALIENKVEAILKRESLRDEIIKNADLLVKYKDKIKKEFKKHECLEFLLNLREPLVSEIIDYVDDSDSEILYDLIEEKSSLIKEIAKTLNDKTLLFSIALYEKELSVIIENFNQFKKAINEHDSLISYLSDVVELLRINNIKNKNIAKILLTRHIGGKYDKKELKYLASQIDDLDFIKKNFNKEHIETDIILLERLAQIDKNKALSFVNNKKDLLGRHWSDVIPLFNFFKEYYSTQIIRNYVLRNKEIFRTSSHLKKHLKDECGIFISQREGNLIVEIKNQTKNEQRI